MWTMLAFSNMLRIYSSFMCTRAESEAGVLALVVERDEPHLNLSSVQGADDSRKYRCHSLDISHVILSIIVILAIVRQGSRRVVAVSARRTSPALPPSGRSTRFSSTASLECSQSL